MIAKLLTKLRALARGHKVRRFRVAVARERFIGELAEALDRVEARRPHIVDMRRPLIINKEELSSVALAAITRRRTDIRRFCK